MRLFTRGVSLAVLSSFLLGMSGCGEDNATAIDQQAAKTAGTQVETKMPPPKDQREFFERSKGAVPTKAQGYPGAKQ
jgi:hypothetical protein